MKLLIDTNIVLDVIFNVSHFIVISSEVLGGGGGKKADVEEYISAPAVTDIYYLIYRQLKDKGLVKRLLSAIQLIMEIRKFQSNFRKRFRN